MHIYINCGHICAIGGVWSYFTYTALIRLNSISLLNYNLQSTSTRFGTLEVFLKNFHMLEMYSMLHICLFLNCFSI